MDSLLFEDGRVAAPVKAKAKPKNVTNDKFNREGWLCRASEKFIPIIKAAGGGALPKFRVSVGWPLGRKPGGNGSSGTIGQCFCCTGSADGTSEIFISPALDNGEEVLAVLLHELVHAFVGVKAKHGKDFKVVAEKTGLTGKMTATVAGKDLVPVLAKMVKELGPYPHAALRGAKSITPKQSTRLLKVECPACGYIVRTTAKWIEHGLPTCPCGTVMATEDGEEGEE